jgi:hypothetical protein
MNQHKMKSLINEARRKTPDATLHLLEKGLRKSRSIDKEWAGEHSGRQRCVALLDAAIARAEVGAERYRERLKAQVIKKTAAEKKRREAEAATR